MSTETDSELRAWMTDWQAGGEPAGDEVRRRVRKQSREMQLTTAVELLFATGMLWFLGRYALRHPTLIDVATMIGLALVVVISVAASLWVQRGLWRPIAEDSATYLALCVARGRQRLRALRAGWWTLAAELALFVPWLWSHRGGRVPLPVAYAFLALLATAAAAGLVIVTRHTRRELGELEALRRRLAAEDS